MNINNLIVISYLAALFIMALLSARKIHTLEDFAVSGRDYPSWVIYATLCATLIGGGFTMGNAQKVHVYGLVYMLAISGIAVREILTSYFIAPHMGQFSKAFTIGDIMNQAYGKPAKIIAGLFAGLLCAGMIGIQLKAMGLIFQVFFGITPVQGILIGCSMVIFYVTLGGFKAVIWTDVLQFMILIIALPVAAILAVHAAGGPRELLAALPPDRLDLFVHYSPLAYLSVLAYFLIGEALSPPYIQRLLVGNPRAVTRAALWTGLTALPMGLVVGTLALSALALNPTGDGKLVIPYIIHTVLPVGIAGIVISAMLAIIMSTADSFLNSAAVTLVHDVAKPLSPTALTSKQELRLMRLFTLTIGILSVILAINFENLVDGILKIYGLWSPIILIPLVAAIRGYQAKTWVFILVCASGLLGSLIWEYGIGAGTQVSGLLVGTLVALAVFLVVRRAD